MRQAEFTALVEVTLETGFGRAIRIDYGVRGAARLFVNAPRAMASLAADVHRVFGFGVESGVSGSPKAAVDFRVAFGAGCRTDELRARDFRWGDDRVVESAAGKQRARHDRRKPKENRLPRITVPGRCSRVHRIVPHELPFCCRYGRILRRLRNDKQDLSTTSGRGGGLLNLCRLKHSGATSAPHRLAKANHLLPKVSG